QDRGDQQSPAAVPFAPGQSKEYERIGELAQCVQRQLHARRAAARQAFGELVIPERIHRAEQRLERQQREHQCHGTSAAQKRPVWKNISPNSGWVTVMVNRNQPWSRSMCSTWVTPGVRKRGSHSF